MTIDPKLLAFPALLAGAVAIAGLGYAATGTFPGGSVEVLEPTTLTRAEIEFPDAPYGVDPVVTGPRTSSFKDMQARADCDKAVWPDIPIGCYPSR